MVSLRLAPAFVATVSALSAGMACNPPRPLPGNPPRPTATTTAGAPTLVASANATASPSTAASVNTTAEPSDTAPQGMLNPSDSQARPIYLNYNDDGCFVYLPFPPLKAGEMRMPGTSPPSQPASCPEALKDEAFKRCRGGILSRVGASCECHVPANPPRISASPCPG